MLLATLAALANDEREVLGLTTEEIRAAAGLSDRTYRRGRGSLLASGDVVAANIDHIAIGPGGVTVIDTKSSRGRVQIATAGILNRREQLLINGRDRTRQLDALQRQITRVADTLDRRDASDVGVLGALCYPFMRREWLQSLQPRPRRVDHRR